MRELTATELQIRQDENGYIGTSVKGEVIMECSSLDKLLMVYGNGRYHVMSPQINYSSITTWFVVRSITVKCLYRRLHRKKHHLHQTFSVGGAIMNRDYFMGASEKSKLLLLADGTPESLYVKYRPAKNQTYSSATL